MTQVTKAITKKKAEALWSDLHDHFTCRLARREGERRRYWANPAAARDRVAKKRNPERDAEYRREYVTRPGALDSARRWATENPAALARYRETMRRRDAAVPAARHGDPWTPSEDALLYMGVSDREIGSLLGRTRESVIRRRRVLAGLPVHDQLCCGPECARPAYAKGLCKSHWTQQYRGRPLSPIRSRGVAA